MKKEIKLCDVCEAEGARTHTLDVIFTTEQDEGRASKPYMDRKTFELCLECWSRRLNGESIFSTGAMGHNQYYFKIEKNDLQN